MNFSFNHFTPSASQPIPAWLENKSNASLLFRIYQICEEKYFQHCVNSDVAHDIDHARRVTKLSFQIAEKYNNIDHVVLLISAYFHDLISYAKNKKNGEESSINCAKKVRLLISNIEISDLQIDMIISSILAHSFSSRSIHDSIESRILYDADKLDALGAIGVARLFAVSGSIGTKLYNNSDPFSMDREPNDKEYALDHFIIKLFQIPKKLYTPEARILAKKRIRYMKSFLDHLATEVV